MGSKAPARTAQVGPPLQTCEVCGAEWFIVHNCPRPPKARITVSHGINLHAALQEAEALIRDQQKTITDLMLELADVRSELDRVRENGKKLASKLATAKGWQE